MPPNPPRRRPGAPGSAPNRPDSAGAPRRPAAGGARRSAAGRSADGGRRPVSGTPRRQGTPPAVLALLVFVPLVLIVVIVAWNHFSDSSPKNAVTVTVDDPNEKIDELDERFQSLREEYRAVTQLDRESGSFEARLEGLVMKYDRFIEDLEAVIGPKRGPDGILPSEFQGYSEMKSLAGQRRVDLIRMKGF